MVTDIDDVGGHSHCTAVAAIIFIALPVSCCQAVASILLLCSCHWCTMMRSSYMISSMQPNQGQLGLVLCTWKCTFCLPKRMSASQPWWPMQHCIPRHSHKAVLRCRLVIAANGVAYLPHEARPGIVPRLLQEILSTRIMVKGAMKSTPASHKVLQVCLMSVCRMCSLSPACCQVP